MKKIYLFIFFLLSFFLINAQDSVKTGKEEFRNISAQFMDQLKSVLVKNLTSEGPVKAISVCSDTAQILTKKFGYKNNVTIKRVTFKPRNQNDTPDAFESKVLKMFEKQFIAGKLNQSSDYIETIDNDSIKVVRYMKPIFIQAPCLNCHGSRSNMKKAVVELLKVKYPNDKAVGYKTGDLRGAISITKVVK